LDGLPEIQKRITRRRHRRKLNPGKSRVAKTRGAQKDNQQRKRCNARFDALRHRPAPLAASSRQSGQSTQLRTRLDALLPVLKAKKRRRLKEIKPMIFLDILLFKTL